MSELLSSICGKCKRVYEDRYCRRSMTLNVRQSSEGTVYTFARICDWCARDHPDLVKTGECKP